MNTKQKYVLWAGIFVLLLMILFPPWVESWNSSSTKGTSHSGFHFILNAPKQTSRHSRFSGINVSTVQLITQAAFMILITGVAFLALRVRIPTKPDTDFDEGGHFGVMG
jgi:hypothetical protein